MEIETITRKWGNSIAVIIPSRIVEQKKIRENEKVIFSIEKKKLIKVKDVFGLFKGKITRPTQEIKDEMRSGWLSGVDRKKEEEWKRKQKI